MQFFKIILLNPAGPDQKMLGFLFDYCRRDAIVQAIKIQINLIIAISEFAH